MITLKNQLEAQRSGFELERRSKGAERSFKAAPKRDRLETEWSGFRSDVVRVWGLEPQRGEAREPKSRMSTNSIIPAYGKPSTGRNLRLEAEVPQAAPGHFPAAP